MNEVASGIANMKAKAKTIPRIVCPRSKPVVAQQLQVRDAVLQPKHISFEIQSNRAALRLTKKLQLLIMHRAAFTEVSSGWAMAAIKSLGESLAVQPAAAPCFYRRFIRIVKGTGLVGTICLLVAGCAFVDGAIEPRSDTLNRSFTDYRNAATLLNIIRASENEPMNFVVVTGATGHNTLSGSQGLPTYVIGPHTVATATAPVVARNFSFGPNSIQESFTNDFNISALDDPQSYGALMTPLDPATIGFFFGRHWPVSILLPLIVSEIRMIPLDGNRVGKVYAFYTDPPLEGRTFIFCVPNGTSYEDSYATDCEFKKYTVNPDSQHDTVRDAEDRSYRLVECRERRAFCVLPVTLLITYLSESGLIFQIPAGSVPGPQQKTPARICFDDVYANFSRGETLAGALMDLFFPAKAGESTHDLKAKKSELQHDFLERISDVPGDTLRNKQPIVKLSRCDDPRTPWIQPASSQPDTEQQTSNGAENNAKGSAAANPKQSRNFRNQGPAYEFYDPKANAIFQIFTRSTWGIYQFLGDVVSREKQTGVPLTVLVRGYQKDHELFKVDNSLVDCFTSILYSGVNHCVPKSAYNTKQTLSLLHELANLYTKPNSAQQPNTGTTRVTQ